MNLLKNSHANRSNHHFFAGKYLNNYWLQHGRAYASSLKNLLSTPFTSFLTIMVIGVTLAFPMALYMLLQNFQILEKHWENSAQISLFLKMEVTEIAGEILAKELANYPQIEAAQYISPAQGLQRVEKQFGVDNVLQHLSENPLPGVIVIKPKAFLEDQKVLHELLTKIKNHPQVDAAQLDSDWIQRLYGFVALGKQAVWIFSTLLGLAAFLVISSTLRSAIQKYQNEIEVIKLVGGTHAFIRRPFLYMGINYGLGGALVACSIVEIVMFLLNGPVTHLASLYQSDYALRGINFPTICYIFLFTSILGLVGAWIAVNRRLTRSRHNVSLGRNFFFFINYYES